MGTVIGILFFFLMVVLAFKVGIFALKIIFTIIGAVVGIGIIVALLPFGLGIALILIIPTIIIGIIGCIIKCIAFII